MTEPTYIWLSFYAVLLLGLILGALISRRYQPQVKASPRTRYLRLRGACIFYGVVCGWQLAVAHLGHEPMSWKKSLPALFMTGCFGLFLFLSWQARNRWRASAEFKALPQQKPSPFLRQAGFILLPVGLLAAFGLYSLRQDRVLAEQEARAAGEVLAQRVAQAIASEGARALREYGIAIWSLAANRSADLGLSSWAGGAVTESNEWQRIRDWEQANPEIDLLTLPPAEQDAYGADGPLAMPPEPPAWLAQLTAEQQALWLAVKQAELAGQEAATVQAVVEKFLATHPSKDAQANAEFVLLLAQTQGLPVAEAMAKIADYAWAHWGNSSKLSDAGLPLGQLISHQALRRLPDGAGLPENFIRHSTIAWMINYAPSIFSPALIAETERVARGTAQEPYAATLRAWWNANAVARQVMDDFRKQYPTNTWKSAAFRVDSKLGTYFIGLDQYQIKSTNSASSQAAGYRHMLLPQIVVAKAVTSAVTKARISLPAYALVEFEWAGTSIPLSSPKLPTGNRPHFPSLGQANEMLKDFSSYQLAYPFRVQVSLANPELLYARQRLRSWLFGGLIVLALAAAVAALLAARRAFVRQLALNEQKSNFVSSVSHELRAPIASVRLMAENLERGKIADAAKQQEYFHFIGQECRRLSSLIENVLDFSRIEQGRKQYEFEPTDLRTLVATTVKLLEPYAAERGVKLETFNLQPSTSDIELVVDGRALQQALVNLIDNAIKHSPKDETVTVTLASAADGVRLSVADHGPGIPAAEQEKIFERFYRRGSELRRETQGIGIGLSLVQHIVKAHGGRVTVQSDVGQGSRFTIELALNNQATKERSLE